MILSINNAENSPIKFKISKFPDGQQTIDIDPNTAARFLDHTIQINSRLNSFKDLELIICANQALRNLGATKVSLYVPYFIGARSDRQFQEGGVNYLKQVICPIINSQNFHSVHVLDPHSDVLEACLNNYYKEDNHGLVDDALSYLIKDGEEDNVVFVSPDAGAYKKIFDVAKKFGIKNIITATKVRDMITGNIISTQVPDLEELSDKKFVIIDDICDGGRTFYELAKVIRDDTHEAKIYLVVTHGIFSAGFEKLSDMLDGIFCTNSVKDIDLETVKVQSRQNSSEFVKQLKVI
jgi:ribose-phosphate pyrophosphokinase